MDGVADSYVAGGEHVGAVQLMDEEHLCGPRSHASQRSEDADRLGVIDCTQCVEINRSDADTDCELAEGSRFGSREADSPQLSLIEFGDAGG